MSVKLVFEFAPNVTHAEVVEAVNLYFGNAQPIPAHVKQAVERVGAEILARDVPDAGTEQSAAIAFGGLVNGGNVNAASSVDAATSTTAHAVNLDTSATSAHASQPLVPPPVNAAHVNTESAAPTNPANVDKNGLPWDARIHSDPAKQTDKGVWRKKRGVDDATVAKVEAELRSIMAIPNGNGASAAPTSKTQSPDLPANLVFADGNAKKQAAIAHANAAAKTIAGPQIIDDGVLDGLLNGKPATLSPQQMAWYEVFFAARNDKFAEFMNKATIAATVANVDYTPAGIDATGLKWDARIHANPPAFDSAGVYVQRMDVSPEYKLTVMREMRGEFSSIPAVEAGNAPTGTPMPNVPPAPAASSGTTPHAVTVEPGSSFVEMMKWIATNQVAKRITHVQVSEVAAMFGFAGADGVGSIAMTKDRSDYWSVIVETLKSYGAV